MFAHKLCNVNKKWTDTLKCHVQNVEMCGDIFEDVLNSVFDRQSI